MTTSGMINTIYTFPGHEGARAWTLHTHALSCPCALSLLYPLLPTHAFVPLYPGGRDFSCRWWGHLFEGQITNDNIWHDQHYLYFSRVWGHEGVRAWALHICALMPSHNLSCPLAPSHPLVPSHSMSHLVKLSLPDIWSLWVFGFSYFFIYLYF